MTRIVLPLAVCAVLLAGCTSVVPAGPASPPDVGVPKTVTCEYVSQSGAAKQVNQPSGTDVAASGTVDYVMTLNETPLKLTLDRGKAPCTVNSFESLAAQGYFDGTVCHRLTTAAAGISVLQCGDPSATGRGGPGYSFADELDGITGYPAGTLAMANAGPDTNGSQFFIVYGDTPLPANYTVFGQLDAAGLAAVAKLAEAGAQGGAPDGPPAIPADIVSIAKA